MGAVGQHLGFARREGLQFGPQGLDLEPALFRHHLRRFLHLDRFLHGLENLMLAENNMRP